MELEFPLTIAYNMEGRKVGCALIQPSLGATFSGGDVSLYFNTDRWELNPGDCKLYTVNSQAEFDKIVSITNGSKD